MYLIRIWLKVHKIMVIILSSNKKIEVRTHSLDKGLNIYETIKTRNLFLT